MNKTIALGEHDRCRNTNPSRHVVDSSDDTERRIFGDGGHLDNNPGSVAIDETQISKGSTDVNDDRIGPGHAPILRGCSRPRITEAPASARFPGTTTP